MNVQGAPKKMFYFYINTSANTYITESILISIELAWQEASNDMQHRYSLFQYGSKFHLKCPFSPDPGISQDIINNVKLCYFLICFNIDPISRQHCKK